MNRKELYSFFNFQVEVDETATRDWYVQSEGWACDCGHCRNFLTLARARELPATVLELLDKLGIPPEKATYVGVLYPDGDGLCYQFSYRIAGNILSGEDDTKEIGRCLHETYPYGAPGFPVLGLCDKAIGAGNGIPQSLDGCFFHWYFLCQFCLFLCVAGGQHLELLCRDAAQNTIFVQAFKDIVP